MKVKRLSFTTYNFIYALWTLFVFNIYFLKQLWGTLSGLVFPVVLCVALFFLMFMQSLVFRPKTVKPLSILFLITNALAGYFISAYHLVLNKTMLANIFDTNFLEATEWMGTSFWIYVVLFGLLPCILVWKTKIYFNDIKVHYLKAFGLLLCICFISAFFIPYKAEVKIYLKENFNLRYQFVPTGYISGLVGAVKNAFIKVEGLNTTKGMVQNRYWKTDKKNLIVFVLGESARDASFSLSGYSRDTASPLKPYLKDMTVFRRTESCGVVTRVSVPCLFSAFSRADYKEAAIPYMTNILDIIHQNGFEMMWLDNELGCNKVCRNIYTEYICQTRECSDILLNDALKTKIPSFRQDSFIVLHQRGSHGPRYDMRVPKEYRKWKPYCDRVDHQACSDEEMKNVYDNTIYYTSFVLADLIESLSKIVCVYNRFELC